MQNNERIHIRVPKSEKRVWQMAAKKSGVSLSEWIRRHVNEPSVRLFTALHGEK